MAFWGCAVKPGKEAPFVPSPDTDEKLHVSQVCLAPGAAKGARATLLLRVGDAEEPLAVAALREGASESAALDLVLDHYTEFSVAGTATVHITGYMMPEYALDGPDDDEDEEYDDDEDPMAALYDGMYGEDGALLEGAHAQGFLGFDENGVPVFADEYDSDADSDFDSEDFDSAEEGGSEDSEEDSEDEGPPNSGVTIEDITETEAGRGAKAAAFSDDDVEGSDEESDSEGNESESEEEEPAPAPAPTGKAKAAAAAAAKKEAAAAAAAAKKEAAAAAAAAKKEAAAAAAAAKKAAAKKEKEEPAAKGQKRKAEAEPAPAKKEAGGKRVRRFANGFEIEDVAMGPANGKLAKPGSRVSVRYVGRLKGGKIFDQTKGSKTFAFRLGVGEVIKGWDRGVEGMRVGDKRRLVIPPQMGYGASRTGPIPPNAELHFDVELVDVK